MRGANADILTVSRLLRKRFRSAYSGKTRPEFERALGMARASQIDVIVVGQ
jgi:hypothetical protein